MSIIFLFCLHFFSFTFSSTSLPTPHPWCLLLTLVTSSPPSLPSLHPHCLLLSTFVWYRLTSFHLYFAWCCFLFSLVFIYIFFTPWFSFAYLLFTGFAKFRLNPFSASSMFVWCAQVQCLVRHLLSPLFTRS